MEKQACKGQDLMAQKKLTHENLNKKTREQSAGFTELNKNGDRNIEVYLKKNTFLDLVHLKFELVYDSNSLVVDEQ